jgi:hypothetical protein
MSKTQHRSSNQEVLARLQAQFAAEESKLALQPSPSRQLLDAVEDAIAGKRLQLEELASSGLAGGPAYVAGKSQLARWIEARRVNR